jgi:hypothetical protein
MNALGKSALTWLVVLAGVGLVFAGRYVWVQGWLNSINPVAPGICRAVATGLKDPADLAADQTHNALFVAAVNRQAAPPYSDKQDGIYLLKLDDPAAPAVKLAGPPPDFHPFSITLFRADDGTETLIAVDRKTNGRNLIETFTVSFDGAVPKLSPQTAIQGGLLVSPNGLAAASPDHFYVTNDRTVRGGPGRFAEDYLLWPHADVLAYNGTGFRIAAQRMTFPAGLFLKNGALYVAASDDRHISAYTQDLMGFVSPLGELSLPARPDKISMDDHGNLIVAGQARPGSSQVYRVVLDARGVPQSYQTIFSDDGGVLRGASAAVIAGGQLFVGASDDSKMLACPFK